MVAPDSKVTLQNQQIDISQLSDEERAKLEEERKQTENDTRDKTLSTAINGTLSKEELEVQRQNVLAKKRNLSAEFNVFHSETVQPLGIEYADALHIRAEKGWKKYRTYGALEDSKKNYNTYSTAYTNLTTTGQLGDVHLNITGVDVSDRAKLTNYVSDKQTYYGELSVTHGATYADARMQYKAADKYTSNVESNLDRGLDAERRMVAEMRYLDQMLQNITAAQNLMDFMG